MMKGKVKMPGQEANQFGDHFAEPLVSITNVEGV